MVAHIQIHQYVDFARGAAGGVLIPLGLLDVIHHHHAPVSTMLAIFAGSATGEVSSSPVMPPFAISSVSASVATQTPQAPPASWRLAISMPL